jgi:hypothetical protein
MNKLEKPYWAAEEEDLPFKHCDFNREIILPGTNSIFLDGAVGIRVNHDFWVVAALPYYYKDKTIQEIVAEFWPTHENQTFNPDHDNTESWYKIREERDYQGVKMIDKILEMVENLLEKLPVWGIILIILAVVCWHISYYSYNNA